MSVPGNAPPAQLIASTTRAPAASVATPGCLTLPATSTTTRPVGVGEDATDGEAAATGAAAEDAAGGADVEGERDGDTVTARARPCHTTIAVPATATTATSATAMAATGDTAIRPSRSPSGSRSANVARQRSSKGERGMPGTLGGPGMSWSGADGRWGKQVNPQNQLSRAGIWSFGPTSLNRAPFGSFAAASRPYGVSTAGSVTVPPSLLICASVASVSSTAK